MSRKKAKPPPPPPPVPLLRRPGVRALLALGTLAAAVALVLYAGERSRDYLQRVGRLKLPVAGIRCDAPPGLERPAFLEEVRFLTGWGTDLAGTDAEAEAALREGFARHPWVRAVGAIRTWPRPATVELTFRVPALAVESSDGTLRAVDAAAVLLPTGAPTAGLIRLPDAGLAPPAPPGNPWPDDTVRTAVRLAERLGPYRERFRLRSLERTRDGWRLLLSDGRPPVLWGNAPGDERPGEATPERKLQRLTEWLLYDGQPPPGGAYDVREVR